MHLSAQKDELNQTSYSANVKHFWLFDVIFDVTTNHNMVLT